MPTNPDGSWTSPTSGRTYPPDTVRSDMDPADEAEFTKELEEQMPEIGKGTQPNVFDKSFAAMGLLPKVAGPDSPGANLSTTNEEEERLRLQRLLGDLQQQATTGGGAWEETLRKATETASASAMALGQGAQTQGGGSVMGALGDIGNAQAAAKQRAAGQGEILRAKSKQSAQDQISALTSGMGQTAAEQATAAAAARRGVKQANLAAIDRAQVTAGNLASGATQALMSSGGEVPGEPETFGDDSANDTVPAWLSPREIVLPLSVTQSEDAPAAAAAFVAALEASEGRGHAGNFADGGEAEDDSLYQPTVRNDYGEGAALLSVAAPHVGQAIGYGNLRNKFAAPGAPSVEGGGLLDTAAYDYARGAQNQNAALLEERAAGRGPSTAPQTMQNTSDANLGAALAARASGRGAGAGEALQRATAAQQGAAGQTAGLVAQEQSAGQQGAAKALLDQQARDNAFAIAQQQAAWQNTMANMGLGIAQQQQLQQMFGAAGQGLAAASSLDFGDTKSDLTDEEQADEDAELNEGDDEFAHGGRVRGAADLAFWDGGDVPGGTPFPFPQRMGGGPVVYRYDPANPESFRYSETAPMPTPLPESGVLTDPFTDVAVQSAPEPQMRSGAGAPLLAGVIPKQWFLRKFMTPGPGEPSALDVEKQLVTGPTDAAMASQAARPKSLVTREQYDAQQAAQPTEAAPAVQPRPGGPGGVGGLQQPGMGQVEAGFAREAAGASALAASKVQEAEAQVAAFDAQQRAMDKLDMERRERTERASQETRDVMARHQAAVNEMKSINTTVDPGRYWASRTTGQKVLGIIGYVLGTFGAAKDGINRAVQMMQTAIDRDIDAQKTQYQLALQKGQKVADGIQSDYAMARGLFQDDVSAMNAARASAWERGALEAKKVAASAGAPQAKAQAEMFIGQAEAKAGDYKNDAAKDKFNAAVKNEELRRQGEKSGGMDPKQLTGLFEIAEREKEIQQSGAKLLGLLDKYGTQERMAPGVEAEMNQAINGMIIASAKMQDREGVVRTEDEARERKSLGFEPGFFQRSSAAREAIKSYIANAERRRGNALAVRGLH